MSELNERSLLTGTILKGVGGFYEILSGGRRYTCRARGKFRLDGVTPVPGDIVDFAPGKRGQNGAMMHIRERKNILIRPAVANIDGIIVVIAAEPAPDMLIVDRLLIQGRQGGIPLLLCCSKSDMDGGALFDSVSRAYAGAGCGLLQFSAVTGDGIPGIADFVRGRAICLAGQSGAGKSSLLNRLDETFTRETGELSAKIKRGKNTTRHAEFFPFHGGLIADTPGFSLLETPFLPPEELSGLYPEFEPYEGLCRFTGCAHDREPDCAVKAAVESGDIDAGRYERYIVMLRELTERKKRQYD